MDATLTLTADEQNLFERLGPIFEAERLRMAKALAAKAGPTLPDGGWSTEGDDHLCPGLQSGAIGDVDRCGASRSAVVNDQLCGCLALVGPSLSQRVTTSDRDQSTSAQSL